MLVMGERRELNPRMVDSQSTALIHLATSAPPLFQKLYKKERFKFLPLITIFYHYSFLNIIYIIFGIGIKIIC